MNNIVVLCNPNIASPLRKCVAEHRRSAYFVSDLEALRGSTIDDALLIAFSTGVIVPVDVLDRVSRAYNFHPGSSRFPGRDPHYWAMLEGAKEFGCTAHVMVEKVDSGSIFSSRKFEISGIHSAEKLRQKTEIIMFGQFESLLPEILADALLFNGECWSGTKRSRKDFYAAGHAFEEYVPTGPLPLEPYDLGNELYFGLHGDQDFVAAVIEFEKAASQSHPQAQLRLARQALVDGKGEQALRWALLAKTNGNKSASEFLSGLD